MFVITALFIKANYMYVFTTGMQAFIIHPSCKIQLPCIILKPYNTGKHFANS